MEGLSEEERRALRGSKFAPLPPPPPRSREARWAHPGGPLKTNKAAALAKFLERKLQDPDGLASLNPDLLHLAVQSAKDTFSSSGTSKSGRTVRHVTSFVDSEPEESSEEGKIEEPSVKKCKKRKKNKEKRNKKRKMVDDNECAKLKKPKKKLKKRG